MKFYEICRDMASRKNNQETSKQSTLLRWVRPDREPSKTENCGEQAVLEETSQESDEQAAGTSNSSNSNINTTLQGPELPPTPDLPSVSKGPNQPKNFKFPQRTFGNSTKKRSFQPEMNRKQNRTESSCLGLLPQMICRERCLWSRVQRKHLYNE